MTVSFKNSSKQLFNTFKINIEDLKNYKQILTEALIVLPYKDDTVLCRQVLNTISMINQYQILELSNEITKLLTLKQLRSFAIESLGFWLQVPSFKQHAYKIFLDDPELEVKFTALLAWASYYTASKDPAVLTKLYNILINDNYAFPIRKAALAGILNVSGVRYKTSELGILNLMHVESTKDFYHNINWNIVTNIMKIFAPEALKVYPIINPSN